MPKSDVGFTDEHENSRSAAKNYVLKGSNVSFSLTVV